MAPDEGARSDLYALLEPRLGRETAVALMNQIPPEGWPDFATKSDIALLQSNVDLLGSRLDRKIDVLAERLSGEAARLDERIGGLGVQIGASEDRVLGAFRGELLNAVTAQNKTLVFSVIGAVISTALAVLGATRFG